MDFDIELVGKIGSMALIDKQFNDIDYNKFSRIGRYLHPGIVWISSGATEIGRLDYLRRSGQELTGDADTVKTDYASQGQAMLMKTYREFIDAKYSVRQVLVEHHHFNNALVRQHLRDLILRCAKQNAVPIINYNDAVSFEENRKMEIQALKANNNSVVELVDNDETAGQIACLVHTRRLLILTSVDGIYRDPSDPSTLINEISGANIPELLANIEECKKSCVGSSRAFSNGAGAKLEYIKAPASMHTKVYIANAKYDIGDILNGVSPCTVIGLR